MTIINTQHYELTIVTTIEPTPLKPGIEYDEGDVTETVRGIFIREPDQSMRRVTTPSDEVLQHVVDLLEEAIQS